MPNFWSKAGQFISEKISGSRTKDNDIVTACEKMKNTEKGLLSLKFVLQNFLSYYEKFSEYFTDINAALKLIYEDSPFYNFTEEITCKHQIIKSEFEGTKEFLPISLKKVLKDKSIYISKIDENGGKGDSQNNCSNDEYKTDLINEDWYVFNDNYGTSEEKQFIKFFKLNIAPKLIEKDLEFYVIRNERVPELAIYSFKDGERFEPDYLLFIRKKQIENYKINQIYAEPKGSQLLQGDKWKEEFMLELEDNAIIDSTFVDGNDYKVLGLPFYNEENTKEEFEKELNKIIKDI